MKILNGIDALLDSTLKSSRRIGLLSHQAALAATGETSAQVLHRRLGRRLVSLLGPEHGFFGLSGAGVATASSVHPDWKLPIHSLYGATRAPTPEMLKEIDTLVFDLSDLGVRCYTYFGTLHLALEACTRAGVRVVVLDRPIPLPRVVEGPRLDPAFASFVAPLDVPMVYGMTPGESAVWICRHLKLALDLQVVKMRGWRRDAYPVCDFVPPSPGIRSRESAMSYAATVFTEALPALDCGRNTALAFRLVGAPWICGEALAERLAAVKLPGVTFAPHRWRGVGGPSDGQAIDGVRLCITDSVRFRPVRTSLELLRALVELHGTRKIWKSAGARPEWFDKLYGGAATRQALLDGESPARIAATWKRFRPVRLYSR